MPRARSTSPALVIIGLSVRCRLGHPSVRHLRAGDPVAELWIALAEFAADPLALAGEDAVTVAIGDLDLVIAVALVQGPT